LGDNTIVLNQNATTQPADGDIVVVVFTGYYDIIVINTNDSLKSEVVSLNGTSGIIENIFTDETIDNFSDADMKATSLLSQYGEREQTISCSCQDLDRTELYLMWNFSRPDLGIVGQYVITERSLSSFGEKMWTRIKLKNKNYFARYGSVLIDTTKTVGKDIKVYKQTVIGDVLQASDNILIESAGLTYYPTSGAFMDPMLDGFYAGI
jgi:hypothetical protein